MRAAATARPGATGWWRANCPFCEQRTGKIDRKQSFGLLMRSGKYHCFRCGISGRIEGFDPTNIGIDPESIPAENAERIAITPPEGFMTLAETMSSISAGPARRYLRSRGLTDEQLWFEAGIGLCLKGMQAGRVVVPILAPDKSWVGWVGRVWANTSHLKYIYPKGMRRGEVLYNQQALLEETKTPIMVVEGVFDALALWPHAVAVLGSPSHAHLDVLATAKRPVAIVLDGDAWEKGEWLAMRLKLEGRRAGSVRLPPGKDPDEVNKSWLHEEVIKCLEGSGGEDGPKELGRV